MNMLEIRKLAECTVEEAVEAWNKGFEGYYFDMATTPEAFTKRGVQEGLSADLSVIAFEDGKPAGIVRNGIREIGGKKVAWNGGTGVALALRGKGAGRKLMEASLALLREAGADIATLEAVSENVPAIELYKKMGYEIIDSVHFLQLKGKAGGADSGAGRAIVLEKAAPEEAGRLPFYRGDFTWQTHWQSVKGGEALIAYSPEGEALGYAYYRKNVDGDGKHTATVLYQCVAGKEDEKTVQALLAAVFGDFSDDINRLAVNVPEELNKTTYEALLGLGFETTTKQVFMKKEL